MSDDTKQPVFFVEHDTIHNCVTSKHVSLDEACEMLNAETTTRIAWGVVVETGEMLRALRAELAKYATVVQAAREWRATTSGMTTLNGGERSLAAAIDALDSKEQGR